MTTPEQPTALTTEQIWDRYAWHATRADVDRVLHFTHWIPRSRGFTDSFFRQWWPGWNLERLIKVFDTAGIRRQPTSRRASAPHGGYCDWRVKEFHFNGRHEFYVEWNGLTEDDGIFHGQATEKSGPLISSWFTARPSAGLPPITERSVDLAQFLTRDDD